MAPVGNFSQIATEAMFTFLDELQANDIINMFAAGTYLQDEYKIDRHQAKDVVLAWMKSKS